MIFNLWGHSKTGALERLVAEQPMALLRASLVNICFWPLTVLYAAILISNPAWKERLFANYRRNFIDGERWQKALADPVEDQTPSCGSVFQEMLPDGSRFHVCDLPRGHQHRLHSDTRSDPEDGKTWVAEQSLCGGIRMQTCALHGEHGGDHQTLDGQKWSRDADLPPGSLPEIRGKTTTIDYGLLPEKKE